MKRAANFIAKLIVRTLILSAILFALYYISMDQSNVFFIQLATGITVGTILILMFLFIFPLFTKKVDTKYYLKNIILGIIASFVFYISQTIYQYFEKLGKLYMTISILTVAIIVFIIIEIMPLAFKSEKKEVEFRTAILGSIASGLIFSIVLNLTIIAINYIKISAKII
jgi:TRAP-type uncharacterized transport system fused permease subunit